MLADLRAPSVKDVGAASEFGIDREPFQVTLAESTASLAVGSSEPSANKPEGRAGVLVNADPGNSAFVIVPQSRS
jgi:hypothetical protein